jgi:subtilase family serine protease
VAAGAVDDEAAFGRDLVEARRELGQRDVRGPLDEPAVLAFAHLGIAITVSSGDGGYGVRYPAASRYVTAVGGTSLTRASNSRGWSESVWSTSSSEGAGSGCSAYDAKPSWQADSGCSRRTVADVSAVVDPATGVAVYRWRRCVPRP